MISRRLTTLAAVLVFCACGPEGTRTASSSDFVQRDSAGIVIATTPGEEADAALGWEVSTVPDLEIGARAPDASGNSSSIPPDVFYKIGGVRQLADGRLVVLDGGSHEVRFFDARGQFLNRVGRKGRGPGEFEFGPFLVPAFDTDSLLLFDLILGRFHSISADGNGYRVITPKSSLRGVIPLGLITGKVLVVSGMIPKPVSTGVHELPRMYAWNDIATGSETPVDSLSMRTQYCDLRADRPAYCYGIPFTSAPTAAMWRNGALVTEGESSEIREYGLDGRLQRVIRVDQPRLRVTDAQIKRYAEIQGRPLFPDLPIPDSMPVFQSLLIGDEGWLWAKLYEFDPAAAATWIVFDTDGRARGSVATPAGLDVQQVGSDFILGIWKNELGVERIRRYALDRRTLQRNE